MVHLNMKSRTRELDVRFKCVEENWQKKKKRGGKRKKQLNTELSVCLSVLLACLPQLFKCPLACCHAALGQWKEFQLRLICVMMTAKYVPISEAMNEPWLTVVIPSIAINCSLLTICYLHPIRFSPLGEGTPLHYLCNPLLGCISVFAE